MAAIIRWFNQRGRILSQIHPDDLSDGSPTAMSGRCCGFTRTGNNVSMATALHMRSGRGATDGWKRPSSVSGLSSSSHPT